MPIPELSIIICHHAGSLILRCLKSLETAKGNFECIIVTSMREFSYQGTGITLIYEQGGPAHKRNVGAKIARGKYLIFLDDDVSLHEDCLVNLQEFLERNPKAGMLFCKIYKMQEGRRNELDDAGSLISWTGFLFARSGDNQQDIGQYNEAAKILGSKSATCAIRKDLFNSINGFSEEYEILAEDTEIAWRVWLMDFEVWYVPSAISWHAFGCESLKPKATYYTLSRIFYLGSRNYLMMLLTHLPLERMLYTIPVHIMAWLISSLGFAVKGKFRCSLLILKGLLDAIIRIPKIMKKVIYIKRTKKVSGRSFLKSITHNPSMNYYLDRILRYWRQSLHG